MNLDTAEDTPDGVESKYPFSAARCVAVAHLHVDAFEETDPEERKGHVGLGGGWNRRERRSGSRPYVADVVQTGELLRGVGAQKKYGLCVG